jgi:hypothetical protein
MEENNSYKLDDTVVAHIAQLLQLAIILNRDIVEQIRAIKLIPSDKEDGTSTPSLIIDPEYREGFDNELKKLIGEAEAIAQKAQKNETGFVQ